MKKNGLSAVMFGMVLALVLAGCASVDGRRLVYNDSIPIEQQSQISIGAGHYFTFGNFTFMEGSFDGEKVDWKQGDTINIPSGTHTLRYIFIMKAVMGLK